MVDCDDHVRGVRRVSHPSQTLKSRRRSPEAYHADQGAFEAVGHQIMLGHLLSVDRYLHISPHESGWALSGVKFK